MTAQELKNSILQLAVQGKLVPQCKEDEPASELMKHISAEKAKLGIKEKSLADITNDEMPFDIPDSWEWVKLGKICRVSTGKKDANFGNENGKYYFFTCAKEPIRCNSFSFEGESILIAGNGDISNISYYDGQFEAYQRTYILQPYIEHSYLYYLLFHIQSNWVKYNIDKMFGSAIPYIRLGNVQNYMVALPPLAEQERIVAKIEELMPLIEEYGKAEEQLTKLNAEFPDKLRKSILQQAVQGKLTERDPADEPASELLKRIKTEKEALIKSGKIKKEKPLPEITEDEKPFDIPDTWEWVRFYNVVDIASNLVNTSDYQGYLHVAPDNIEKNTGVLLPCRTVKEDSVISPNHLFFNGQIIYSKIRPLLRKAVIAPFDGLCSADMYPLNTHIISEYLLLILLSDFFNNQVSSIISNRVKMPKINKTELGKTILPIPPLAEQKRIVKRVDEPLALCDELK